MYELLGAREVYEWDPKKGEGWMHTWMAYTKTDVQVLQLGLGVLGSVILTLSYSI